MAINLSPNMSLPVPGVGTEAGPDYATDVNNCLTILDAHDHSPGSGVQITPEGININADLLFNGQNATTLRSARFTAQPAPLALSTDLGCIYESGVDLYYNDGAGNQIRITQSGGIAGTPGSIANLTPPASASYVAGNQTFVFQSNVLTPANIDGASYILRNLSASSFGLTLTPPTLSSDYSITLPALPAQTNVMTLGTSGIISSITYNQVANLRTRTVGTSVASAGGVGISSSCGAFSSASTTPVAVTNLSVSIVTSGRPVSIALISDGTANKAILGANGGASTNLEDTNFYLYRDGVQIAQYALEFDANGTSTIRLRVPPGCINHLDPVASGTYVYAIYAAASSTAPSPSVQVNYCKLSVYEI